MMTNTVTGTATRILLAGALALTSQGAVSGDANIARSEPEVLIVTAQRPQTQIVDSRIETSVRDQIEALNRRFDTDLEKDLAAISRSRIELAVSEVPTRG